MCMRELVTAKFWTCYGLCSHVHATVCSKQQTIEQTTACIGWPPLSHAALLLCCQRCFSPQHSCHLSTPVQSSVQPSVQSFLLMGLQPGGRQRAAGGGAAGRQAAAGQRGQTLGGGRAEQRAGGNAPINQHAGSGKDVLGRMSTDEVGRRAGTNRLPAPSLPHPPSHTRHTPHTPG